MWWFLLPGSSTVPRIEGIFAAGVQCSPLSDWIPCRDSDVVPMSNNMIAYGFNDVTFGGDLTEAMISLRPLKFTRYECPNSGRPVAAIFYLMKIMYVYGVGYILNCAIHILHWVYVFNSSLKRYLLVIVHCGEFTKGNLFCLLYFLNKKLSHCTLYVMYPHVLVYPTCNQYAINNTIFFILCVLLWKLFLPPVATHWYTPSRNTNVFRRWKKPCLST